MRNSDGDYDNFIIQVCNMDIIGEPTEVNIGHIGPNQNIEPSPKGEVQYSW